MPTAKRCQKQPKKILDNPYAYLSAATGLSVDELKDDEDDDEETINKDWDFLETYYR